MLRCGLFFIQLSWVNVSPTRRNAMAVPSTFRKTEVVTVQHVMEGSEKPLTPDGVEIRHVRRKFVIPGRPYKGSLTAQMSEVSLLHCDGKLFAARCPCSFCYIRRGFPGCRWRISQFAASIRTG